MTQPHIIRLRGPWDYLPVARYISQPDGGWCEQRFDAPPAGRAKVPGDWGAVLGADFCGRVRYTRHFGCPTGLEPGERVWLVVEQARDRGAISLNDRPLGQVADAPARFDITDELHGRNRLVVEVEQFPLAAASGEGAERVSACPGGLIGEVRLEIAAAD